MKKTGIRDYLFLHIVLIIYSLTSVLSKSAADKTGIAFVVLYGAVLFCLMLYAVLWQGVLKKFPLTTAFANKAIVVVWGILWGWLFFDCLLYTSNCKEIEDEDIFSDRRRRLYRIKLYPLYVQKIRGQDQDYQCG